MADEITIGSKVMVKLNGDIKELQVVGSADVDAAAGKISYLSPIGEALLGKKVGDSFRIELPSRAIVECRVISII